MACCKCCCGNQDCAEGQIGKCCCGGTSGVCCQEDEYCCSGECEPSPCTGACCDDTFGCTQTADEATCTGEGGTWLGYGIPCDPNPCECGDNADCQRWCKVVLTGAFLSYPGCRPEDIGVIEGCVIDANTEEFVCTKIFAKFDNIDCDEDEAVASYIAEVLDACPAYGEVVYLGTTGFCCDNTCQSAECPSPSALVTPKSIPAVGPGTELKKLLSRIGIKTSPTCSCNKRAMTMDANGVEWCEQNVETICDWLAEESAKRKLPFLRAAGKVIIAMAIKRAKKNTSK